MSKPTLTLQPGKIYVTNSGEHITLEEREDIDPFYTFIGSNYMLYGYNGRIFRFDCAYGDFDYSDDISHELAQDEEPKVELIDVLKFKQKSNGIKRKLTLKDYSDDSVEIIFKTKFSRDEPQVTTGIRLSYEAVLMLYNSLEYMLEEQNVEQSSTLNQRTLH